MVVQTGLRAYSDQLQSNPEPSNVKELMANVALWGSQIKDLDNTVKSLKQQQETLSTLTQTLGKNLTTVEVCQQCRAFKVYFYAHNWYKSHIINVCCCIPWFEL